MKQKLVVRVCMNCEKCHSKALKIAVSLRGVESASLKGDDKSQTEVTGEGVDPVQLVCVLRKKLRQAELVTVSAVSSGSGDNEVGHSTCHCGSVNPPALQYVWPCIPLCYACEVPYYHEPGYCSIQ